MYHLVVDYDNLPIKKKGLFHSKKSTFWRLKNNNFEWTNSTFELVFNILDPSTCKHKSKKKLWKKEQQNSVIVFPENCTFNMSIKYLKSLFPKNWTVDHIISTIDYCLPDHVRSFVLVPLAEKDVKKGFLTKTSIVGII